MMKHLLTPLLTVAATAVVLAGVQFGIKDIAASNAKTEQLERFSYILPGSSHFEKEAYTGEDENIVATYKGENGYVVETKTDGYVHEISLYIGVNNDGEVVGMTTKQEFETMGLGERITTDSEFLEQFLGTNGNAEVGSDIDAITGATVTSKAVTRAVNSASAFVTGADITSSATEWGN